MTEKLSKEAKELLAAMASDPFDPKKKECQCLFSKRVLGDGCRYCQPQRYIDRLEDRLEELEMELGGMPAPEGNENVSN